MPQLKQKLITVTSAREDSENHLNHLSAFRNSTWVTVFLKHDALTFKKLQLEQFNIYHSSIGDADLFPNCWWITSHADKHHNQDGHDDDKDREQTDTYEQTAVIALSELHAHNTTDKNLKLRPTLAEIIKTVID